MHSLLRIALVAFAVATFHARADVVVVEYHHPGFGHYFVTSVPDEIVKLDAKVAPFEQWSRTGRAFRAHKGAAAQPGSVAVCRFFNDTFAPRSSHFYAPRGFGCEDVVAKFPDWRLETDNLFEAALPDTSGACHAGTIPVYRLYNNGQGGAPNHRFVTSLDDRNAMIAMGYVPEGAGMGVGMCAPGAANTRTTAQGLWRGVTSAGREAWIVVLDNGKYYLVHGDATPAVGVGLVTGTFSHTASAVVSTDAVHISLSASLPDAGTVVQGVVASDALSLNFGQTLVTALYDPSFEQAGDLGALAGSYTGASGHLDELGPPGSARTRIEADGNISINGITCRLVGKIAPRATGNVFEGVLGSTATGSCRNLTTLNVLVVYDAATRRLAVLSQAFRNPFSGLMDVYATFGTRD